MHVPDFKPRARKGRGHFHLRVDALLAKNGQFWLHIPRMDVGPGRVLVAIKGRFNEEPLVIRTSHFKFAVRARRIVAAAGDFVRHFAPRAHQRRALFIDEVLAARVHDEGVVVIQGTDHMEVVREARGGNLRLSVREPIARNLHHGADFFIKERRHHRERILRAVNQGIEIHREAAVRGKHHFAQGGRETAVALVVVGLDAARQGELAHDLHKPQKLFRRGSVGGFVTKALRRLREDGAAHARLAARQVKHRYDAIDVGAHFGRQGKAHVRHRRRRGNDQRHGARHGLLYVAVRPRGLHGAGVFAHRNREPRRLAVDARRLHGFIKTHVFACGAAGRHPIRGQLHQRRINVRRRDVRHGLGDRHAACGCGIQNRHGRSFAHRHRFALEAREVHVRHGAVSDRHLPGADVLVAGNQAAHRAVANRNEEGLVGDRRMLQDGLQGFGHRERAGIKGRKLRLHALYVTVHARGLSKEHVHRHVDRTRFALAPFDDELIVFADAAQNGVRAALALTKGVKRRKLLGRNRDHIALLTFVAPDFQGAHALFFNGHLRQGEVRAVARKVRELRHGVRQPARPHVVNGEDGVVGAARPAAVDHFLRPALHLGVAALHGVKVKAFGVRARRHRARRAAPETDAHAGAAQHDHEGARRKRLLGGLIVADVADAAREHDGLVVAVALGADVRFKRAEVPQDVRAAEFVIKRRGADRAFGHDGQGRRDARGRAISRVRLFARHRIGVVLPRLRGVRKVQRRNREAAEPRLGLGAAARGAFVADFTAGARGRAWEGADRGRVVVRLDLEDRVHGLQPFNEDRARGILLVGPRVKARHRRAFKHSRIVAVGDDRAARALLVRLANHAKEGLLLLHAVDREFSVEDLVAAVLGIGLREHHQFDVRGIAALAREGFNQVGDFVLGQREAHFAVGLFQCGAAACLDVHDRHGLARDVRKEHRGIGVGSEHRLRHAVKEALGDRSLLFVRHVARNHVAHAALDAVHGVDAAVVHDVSRLARPGADRPQARHRQEFGAGGGLRGVAVVKKRFKALHFSVGKRALRRHEMNVGSRHRGHAGGGCLQNGQQALGAEGGKGIAPRELQNHGRMGHVVTCR